MSDITLITGGSRSGKSTYALQKALEFSGKRVFVATAIAFDDEMTVRIQKHKDERSDSFLTIEEPYHLSNMLQKICNEYSPQVILVDCLTVWLGNLFYQNNNDEKIIRQEIEKLLAVLIEFPVPILFVTNEVGSGIVPENALARQFRDMAGFLNQAVARVADEVVMCCCGIPVKIK